MNYYIGMHNSFDYDKYRTDYYNRIKGIEFCNFTSQVDIEKAISKSREDGYHVGIHFPFNKSNYKHRDPLVMSQSSDEREEAFLAIENEICFASVSNAKYLLFHFPKPAVLSRQLDWTRARLGSFEFIFDDQISFEDFKALSNEAFQRLDELSNTYQVPIVLEIELINEWIYETHLLEDLLDSYPNISVCLDTARLHVISKTDERFDALSFIKRMSKYTSNLHISNIQVGQELKNGHHPVLPYLRAEDKWCDIQELLLSFENKTNLKHVLFEHRSDRITKEELDECYEWIHELLSMH